MDDDLSPPGTIILHHLAIGRLIRDADTQEWLPNKHKLIASNFEKESSSSKQFKKHLKAILQKGSEKLGKSGKRIRLQNEENNFDVHILTDSLPNNEIVLFFAITISNYSKYFPIANLLRDFKVGVYEKVSEDDLLRCSKSVQRDSQPVLERIMKIYGQSPLLSARRKVEDLKEMMHNSVEKALSNVEKLEDLDERSEQFAEQAKQFTKRAKAVKVVHRKNYYVMYIIIALILLGVILYFVIPEIIDAAKKSSDPMDMSSSSSTGEAALAP